MVIKDCYKDKFYEFNPDNFKLKEVEERNCQGKLFRINWDRYVLLFENSNCILQSKHFKLNLRNYIVSYKESRFHSFVSIYNDKDKFLIKNRKSIWELLNISTYDKLEKIEDNSLYYLFDIIYRFKKLKSEKEEIDFIF